LEAEWGSRGNMGQDINRRRAIKHKIVFINIYQTIINQGKIQLKIDNFHTEDISEYTKKIDG